MNGHPFIRPLSIFSASFRAKLIHAASRPSWRQKGKPARPTKPGAPANVPNWAEHGNKPKWDGPSSRILGLILLGFMIPALLFAWKGLLPDHESTPLLVITTTEYRAPVPPNAYAAEDGARMREAYDPSQYHNIELLEPAQAPKDSAGLLRSVRSFLEDIEPGGPDKDVVMIYLSAHGVVNAAGEPCLLLPDHKPLDCETWLPVAQLIETIVQNPRLKDCKKIVMLDATRIDDAWRLGIFANTFSIALKSLLSHSPPANCFILNASTGLETALAAPEISGTAFGYFVTAGLRGAADEQGNGNGVVTLEELAIYLREQVDSWALSHRAVHQRPAMIAAGKNIPKVKLAYVAGYAELATDPWSPSQSVDNSALWARIEELENQQVYAQSPIQWGYLQFLVERYDAEFVAGSAYNEQAGQTLLKIQSLLEELEKVKSDLFLKPISLAIQKSLDDPFDDPLKNQLDAQAMTEIWNAWSEKPAEAKAPEKYAGAAAFAWQQLVNKGNEFDRQSLERALQFCDFAASPEDFAAEPEEEFTEIALLRLIDAHADWESPGLAKSSALQHLFVARELSEELAAPEDSRQHYAIAHAMSQRDTDLALAFDQILTGNNAALKHASEQLDTLLGKGDDSYDNVRKQSDLIRRALRSRDQSFATLLHLTQFVARRGKFEKSFRTRYDLANLAENTLRLANLFETTIAESIQNDQSLNENLLRDLSEQINGALDVIIRRYNQRVTDIPDQERGSNRAIHYVEIPHLLRCPIKLGSSHQTLRRLWIEQLQQSSDAKSSSQDQVVDPRGDAEYLSWLVTTGLAPLEKLLNWRLFVGEGRLPTKPFELSGMPRDASEETLAKQLAQLGSSLRTHLRKVPTTCRALSARSEEVLSEQPAQQARRGYTLADRLTRALGPLKANRLWFKTDNAPARRLRKLDAQALVLWHGNRLLDDFWGDWKSSSEPYFAVAASQQAAHAEDLLDEAQFGTEQLRKRITQSLATLREWQPLRPQKLSVSDESMLRHRIDFQRQPNIRPGHVSIYLTNDNDELFVTRDANNSPQRRRNTPTGGERRDFSTAPQPIDYQIPGEDLRDEEHLYANALFRGHVKRATFSIGRGVSVPWRKPDQTQSTIVVRGDAKQVSQLIFIVDCSGSMGSRLRRGSKVLSNILDSLLQQRQKGQYKVGLVFYGRRASFEQQGAKRVFRNIKPVVLEGEPQNIHPNSDVEIAAPPKILRDTHLRRIKTELNQARPNGQTPLYLALYTALGMIEPTSGGPRHVIAITDGDNDLYKHPNFPTPINKTNVDVEEMRQRVNAKIHVIEFNKKTDDRRILIDITRRSGGSFHQIGNESDLLQLIRDALRLDRFRVTTRGTSRNAAEPEWQELGSPVTLSKPMRFDVQLQQHDTAPAEGRVEGGEALQLEYQLATNRLGFRRYDFDDLSESQTVGEFLVAAHVPYRELNQPTTFRISIQNRNERFFSPRPEVLWAKVTPMGGISFPSFFFVDRQFEHRLPVPMLQFPARGWPRGAQFAKIELGFAMHRSSLETQSIPISNIETGRFEAHGAVLQVEPKMTRTGLKIMVDEKHDDAAKHYPLHLHLDPQPDRISRTYFETDSRARTVFHYTEKPANPKLLVLTRREIESKGDGALVFENVELPR